jgi:rhodanese-related sulfurtransferase
MVKNLIDAGEVYIIDARPVSDYEKGHIPTAINIPYNKLPDYIDEVTSLIDVNDGVLCYCTGPDCDFSHQVATELGFLGYTKVAVFTGGWEHWEAAGFEVETGETDL